jgi:cytochrome subunit of sulfide dehydrogenase
MHATRPVGVLAAVVVWSGWAVAAQPEPPPGASSCSGCHAAKAGVDSAVPRLAGRAAGEIAELMWAFKSGSRPATVMDRIARGLTDAEIEAIAAWYAQQK